ncbi:MAG: hypothetical protein NT126_00600 [Bacteroidetes bacterium]|nr:hypothetical protein [Bacteroidota bacterium]
MKTAGTLFILFFCVSFFSQKGNGQDLHGKISDRQYEKHPYWIAMMGDTTTNYFETLKAFNLFWKSRTKPVEEEEIIGQEHGNKEKRKNSLEKLFQSRAEKEREESEQYAFQYKKFRNWLRATLPYVESNGYILTPSERLRIWEQQKSSK